MSALKKEFSQETESREAGKEFTRREDTCTESRSGLRETEEREWAAHLQGDFCKENKTSPS